jgi:excisionase family DNA binding protein
MNDQTTGLLTVQSVMDLTGRSRNTIYKYIRTGYLKAYKFGERGYLISPTDLTACIKKAGEQEC